MTKHLPTSGFLALALCGGLFSLTVPDPAPTSYLQVASTEPFAAMRDRLTAAKGPVMARQLALLQERYDLADRPAPGVAMSRGKPVQAGVRVKLPPGLSWEQLAALGPAEIREKGLFPQGFLSLPHPDHPAGGMVFPRFQIDETLRQEARDLTRFDLDFDVPDRFLPEFPPPLYLTTRPDLGDVSKGRLVTLDNFFELFNGIVNPKKLEGLRLLVTPFPQQQFNATDDRRSLRPSRGVACFDCHANGHTNGATHLSGEQRPQAFRHRIDTPSLRGVNIQRLFGSQRALKTVEDFTEFEQRAAYFDGDPVTATKKGVNVLDRGSQVHDMAEFQEMLDFPPAPKLKVDGTLDPALATAAELRGQTLFFGKAACATCHPGPYYTDKRLIRSDAACYKLPLSPISAATPRMASMVSPVSVGRSTPSMAAPFSITPRSTPAAKERSFHRFSTDFTGRSSTLLEGRTSAAAVTSPVSSSMANRVFSMRLCGSSSEQIPQPWETTART
jgi:cytochrome c peroxidase